MTPINVRACPSHGRTTTPDSVMCGSRMKTSTDMQETKAYAYAHTRAQVINPPTPRTTDNSHHHPHDDNRSNAPQSNNATPRHTPHGNRLCALMRLFVGVLMYVVDMVVVGVVVRDGVVRGLVTVFASCATKQPFNVVSLDWSARLPYWRVGVNCRICDASQVSRPWLGSKHLGGRCPWPMSTRFERETT